MDNLTATAAKQLSPDTVKAIYQNAARDYESQKHNTMIRSLGDDETPLPSNRTTRSVNGLDVYEIDLPGNTADDLGREWPHAILKDGDLSTQVGAITIDQAGGAIAKFSRSENCQEARRRFETGGAALHVAYLNKASGRKPAAFSLRAVTDGLPKRKQGMSDIQEIARLGAKYGILDAANTAIVSGKSLEKFRKEDLWPAIETPQLHIDAPEVHSTGAREYSLAAQSGRKSQATGITLALNEKSPKSLHAIIQRSRVGS